ncbi:hypothetical protein C5167_022146 [Papaver somniferum]|uniref:Uncharacterized protein n=1 Tax=Papaver somniferum TaxID=3469 RepID=A0A4Y7JGY7_PAPSO|nr:hypothetical protein C5167_022146 [Papaver somniferum]
MDLFLISSRMKRTHALDILNLVKNCWTTRVSNPEQRIPISDTNWFESFIQALLDVLRDQAGNIFQ